PLDGRTYQFQIAGTDPTASPAITKVPYVPIMLRVHFPGGVVLDPTLPGCGDTVSVSDRFFGSPLFKRTPLTSNGAAVGNTQIFVSFQRAEFWSLVKSTDYHLYLTPARNVRIIDVTAPAGSSTQSGACTGSGHD